jgi:hypothetical protein
MIKGRFELQARDGLVQSYQDVKTTVKSEVNGKKYNTRIKKSGMHHFILVD